MINRPSARLVTLSIGSVGAMIAVALFPTVIESPTGPTIVANQTNLAQESEAPGLGVSTAELRSMDMGTLQVDWQYKSEHNTKAACESRGKTLVELGTAAEYRCYKNSKGKWVLMIFPGCTDIVAPDPSV